MTVGAHRQASYRVRFEWAMAGAGAVAEGADVAVVVDVLSFTTTLSVAVERGITVYPFRWKDERAEAYAVERDAVLARERSARTGVSLSPVSVRDASGIDRMVLPSPNGSAIAFDLAATGATGVGACRRNAAAGARGGADRGGDVAVVAAGERWPDDTLRPAVEDLWGAGAVVAGLVDLGVTDLSAEARVAEQAFRAARFPEDLVACASGRELADLGFPGDVAIAAEVDRCSVVPLLVDDAFVEAR